MAHLIRIIDYAHRRYYMICNGSFIAGHWSFDILLDGDHDRDRERFG